MKPLKRSFASDNNAGIHPRVLEAIARANVGHAVAYGDDPFTAAACARFKAEFGEQVETYPVFNGTGANVLALSALAKPYEAILCAEGAHIAVDECGAPERFTGCKLIGLTAPGGKLRAEDILEQLHALGNQHHVQPRVISISNVTELGTVYSPREIRALADVARSHGLFLHVDGARIANAAAALGVSLRELTTDSGVDVLSFGGTKNGLMLGEAVVVLKPELARGFEFVRKQGMQLASKMRFISAQLDAILTDGLWNANASHANAMARILAEEIRKIPALRIVNEVQANSLFVAVPKDLIQKLQQEFHFYVWEERSSVVRWMTSWDTTQSDISEFVGLIRQILG